MRRAFRPATIAIFIFGTGSSFAADGTYAVSKTDASATVGGKAKASVTIVAKKGWHLNMEAPLTLKLAPAPGVLVDKPSLGRGNLALSGEAEARFDVGVTLSEPGKRVIEAEAGFVLCQRDSCRPIKEKLTLTTEATVPPAAPAKKAKNTKKKASRT